LWSTCDAGCPTNAFLLGHQIPAVHDVLVPFREVLSVALFAVVGMVMTRRRTEAEPVLGQAYSPIAWIAVLEAISVFLYAALRDGRTAPGRDRAGDHPAGPR